MNLLIVGLMRHTSCLKLVELINEDIYDVIKPITNEDHVVNS